VWFLELRHVTHEVIILSVFVGREEEYHLLRRTDSTVASVAVHVATRSLPTIRYV